MYLHTSISLPLSVCNLNIEAIKSCNIKSNSNKLVEFCFYFLALNANSIHKVWLQNLIILSTQAWKLHRDDKIVELLDPELRVTTAEEIMEVQRTLETALMCIQAKVEMRPNMFTVLSMLLGESNMAITVDESHEDWLPNFTAIAYRRTREDDDSKEYSNGRSSDSRYASQFVSKESLISLDPLSRSSSGDSGESDVKHSSSESATDHTHDSTW